MSDPILFGKTLDQLGFKGMPPRIVSTKQK